MLEYCESKKLGGLRDVERVDVLADVAADIKGASAALCAMASRDIDADPDALRMLGDVLMFAADALGALEE